MDTMALVGRLLISLAAVLGLIWLVARKFRGGAGRKTRSHKLIDVLGRQNLTRSSSMAVVRVGGKALIVGITDASVRVLGNIELDAIEQNQTDNEPEPNRPSVRESLRNAVAGRSGAAASATPSSPAALTGTLTEADIDAIRAARDSGRRAAPDIPAPRAAERTSGQRATTPNGPTLRDAGMLGGSALSPTTWRQTMDALREMTVRKG